MFSRKKYKIAGGGNSPPHALRLAFFEFRVLRPYLRLRGSANPGKIPRQNSQQLKLITKGALRRGPAPNPAARPHGCSPDSVGAGRTPLQPLAGVGIFFFFSDIFPSSQKKKMNLAPRGLLPLCPEEKWLLYFFSFSSFIVMGKQQTRTVPQFPHLYGHGVGGPVILFGGGEEKGAGNVPPPYL